MVPVVAKSVRLDQDAAAALLSNVRLCHQLAGVVVPAVVGVRLPQPAGVVVEVIDVAVVVLWEAGHCWMEATQWDTQRSLAFLEVCE